MDWYKALTSAAYKFNMKTNPRLKEILPPILAFSSGKNRTEGSIVSITITGFKCVSTVLFDSRTH